MKYAIYSLFIIDTAWGGHVWQKSKNHFLVTNKTETAIYIWLKCVQVLSQGFHLSFCRACENYFESNGREFVCSLDTQEPITNAKAKWSPCSLSGKTTSHSKVFSTNFLNSKGVETTWKWVEKYWSTSYLNHVQKWHFRKVTVGHEMIFRNFVRKDFARLFESIMDNIGILHIIHMIDLM